ncbi:MAG: ATP-binding protein [Holosporaceae bacterium]|nr:ATP-binding protein [Holosporaceae bacterium]
MKFKRWQENSLVESLKTSRVTILAGARQCGKTTIANQLASAAAGDIDFRSLDDVAMLTSARADPHGFVHHNKRTLIIDEIQRAPDLLMAIKKEVDENPAHGRFLITGSADIQSLPTVSESLAGRVSKVLLHPLSQGEIAGSCPNFIEKALQQQFHCDGITKREALELAVKGGFPESVLSNRSLSEPNNFEKFLGADGAEDRRSRERYDETRNAFNWCNNYVTTLIEHDLRDISNIRRHGALKELIKVLAAWSSKFMDKAGITSALSITKPTFDSYFFLVQNMFLVDTLEPWLKTDYEYVSKKHKIFMSDTGLMAGILGWNLDQVEFDQDKCGKLMETFVHNQLVAEIDASSGNYSLYQYRDSEKREIDFIVQNRHNDILAIEVKSGSNVSSDSFKHIKWFREMNQKRGIMKNFVGIVVYTGRNIAKFGNNLWAIPLDALWK